MRTGRTRRRGEVRVRVPRPGPRRRDVLPVRHLRACPSASLSPGPAPRRARDEDATGGEKFDCWLARRRHRRGAPSAPSSPRAGPPPRVRGARAGPRPRSPPAAPRRNARARPRPARRPRRPCGARATTEPAVGSSAWRAVEHVDWAMIRTRERETFRRETRRSNGDRSPSSSSSTLATGPLRPRVAFRARAGSPREASLSSRASSDASLPSRPAASFPLSPSFPRHRRWRRAWRRFVQLAPRDQGLAHGRPERRTQRPPRLIQGEAEGFLLHPQLVREHRGRLQPPRVFLPRGLDRRRGFASPSPIGASSPSSWPRLSRGGA